MQAGTFIYPIVEPHYVQCSLLSINDTKMYTDQDMQTPQGQELFMHCEIPNAWHTVSMKILNEET